ncbi:ABC transporter substrate-binding protein [Roseateles oligotrophus]|uniref:ABC transporter substrate-binding protein n=1 Tax=Roseateles oligotrophus TaxID=1769250 RepID=A0ABT2YKV2_9BURK|nr:ABC transporter substrate-binding protein [Roseateles oligotrophus]MCV2370700.1 ABC transporter substrate-binding protein [Roseateles oligotrophus]
MKKKLLSLLFSGLLALSAQAETDAVQPKVLRYAFPVAETNFDPSQINDLYSRTITGAIFEALYRYDHLARPVQIKPLIAAAMPEVSPDSRQFTIKIQPGIYFADDPAFKGKKRELTAADFVYMYKRFADPALKSPGWSSMEEAGVIGLLALRKQGLANKKPFDYDQEIEGLRALDRYTLQIKLEQSRPRLLEKILTGSDLYGPLAREVVEHYGAKVGEHPVGTGPFKLAAWRRSSQIVLEKNPDYRERYYDAEALPGDAEGLALQSRFKGRRIPMIDRIEVAIIEEAQPRWLSFLNGEKDFAERVPAEFISQAMPNGHVAPNLAKKGIQGFRTLAPDAAITVYNMEDPVIGGMEPAKIALRRAVGLAIDVQREIRLARRGQAVQAQSPLVPHTTGYDAEFKSEIGDYDLARAKALLDLYGYVDQDGDGWRDQPDGSPLILVRKTQPDSVNRQLDELWQKNLTALGIKIEIQTAKWPENMKSVRGGKFMIWGVGSSASDPDGQGSLQRLYGPSIGGQNLARFRLPAYDKLYDQLSMLPDGPEREALFLEAKRLATVYSPYKQHVHRIITDLAQPWLIGYRRALFWQDWWQYVDIDESKRPGR